MVALVLVTFRQQRDISAPGPGSAAQAAALSKVLKDDRLMHGCARYSPSYWSKLLYTDLEES